MWDKGEYFQTVCLSNKELISRKIWRTYSSTTKPKYFDLYVLMEPTSTLAYKYMKRYFASVITGKYHPEP